MASTSTGGLGFSTPPDQLLPSASITHLRYEESLDESSEGMMYCINNERFGTSITTKINFSEDGNKIADDQGNTWLHIGTGAGIERMVCGFIAKGGNDLDIDIRNGKDETPFMLAARIGNLKVAEILLANGADIDAFVRNESSGVVRNTTALTLAAEENKIDMVRFLLQNSASIAEDAAGFTPLYYVLGKTNLEVVGALIDGGCSPHHLTKGEQNSLHFAALNPDPEIVRTLVTLYKVNPNQRNIEGLLPLHYAHNPDVKKILLENGTVLDSKDLIKLLNLNASEKAIALPEDGKILESGKSCLSTSFNVTVVLHGASSSHAASSVPSSSSSISTLTTDLAFDVDTTTPLELIQAHADAISDPALERPTQGVLSEMLRILNVRFPGKPITMSSTLEKHNRQYKLSLFTFGDGSKFYKANTIYTLIVDDPSLNKIKFTKTTFTNFKHPRDPKEVLLSLQAYMEAVLEIVTPAAERTHLVIRPDQEYDLLRAKSLKTMLNKDPLSGEYIGVKFVAVQEMDITLNWIEESSTSRYFPRVRQIGHKTYRSEFDWIDKGAPYIIEGIHEIEVERIQAGVLPLQKFLEDVRNKENNLKGIVNNSFMQFNGVFGSRDSSDVTTYAAFPSAYEAVHAAWDSEPKSAVDASRWESVSKVKAYVNAYNRKFQNIPNIFERLERQLVGLYETMSDRIVDVRKAYNELKEMRYAIDKLVTNRIRVPEKVISQLQQTSQRLQATETSIEELFGRLGFGNGEEEASQGISKQISSAVIVPTEYFIRESSVTGASSSTSQHYEPQQHEEAVRMPTDKVNWSKDPEDTFKEMIESGQFVSESVILQEVERLKKEFAENRAVVRWELPNGKWGKGTFEGEGAQIHSTGIVQKGKFVKGNMVEGWSFFPDGHWIQGTCRGEGVRIQSSKAIEKGLFVYGKLVRGELINGPEHLVGDFTGEGFTGEGTRINPDIKIREVGKFEKGKLIQGISTSFTTGIEMQGTFEGYGRRQWTDLRASEKRIAGWKLIDHGVVEVGKFENGQLVEGTRTSAEGEIREYKRVNGRVEIITLHKPENTCSLQ